ncbi:MAG: TrkA C-terminal domain-containing protein [Acidimicrobiales bacterium]|nr:TrkA C-terminal domain-containing protein [Acidimicrobiales bacterium]
MIALISLFVIVLASLVITRVAAVMLSLTGLSIQSARFQARSAFSGTGFTSSETEAVVNHPVRRRIIMTLMLLGNAGIVTGIVSLLLSFAGTSGLRSAGQIIVIVAFLTVLIRLSHSATVDRLLSRIIERSLRRFTQLDVRDYAGLLHLADEWIIGEISVEAGDWLCDHTIESLQLANEGVLVLGIERADNRYIGTPRGHARFHEGDMAVLYGRRETIDRIDVREHDVAGEMDWVSSQIDFTEHYLETHEQDRDFEDTGDEHDPDEHHLHAGERAEDDEADR